MRRISVKDITKALKMRYVANMSLRDIATAIKLPHTTIADYCRRFNQCGYELNVLLSLNDDIVFSILFKKDCDITTKDTATICKKVIPKAPKPIPDASYIHKEIAKKGVTFELLWMEYKEVYPDGYGLSQFKEYYYKYKQRLNPSMRQTHIPGDKMFVDYSGLTMNVVDKLTGEVSKAQIFVAVLGASGYTFVHATTSQTIKDFILSHTKAFDFFGGVPNMLVPDNLKSAIISNNKFGVVENETYSELSRHYGCVITPARPKKPKDKPKVEQGVQGIQRWLIAVLRNRVFFDVDEINQAFSQLLDRYNNKVMKHIGKSRQQLFDELEKDALLPLPINKFIYKQYKLALVHLDYHVELERCFYSVPYKYLKEKVEIRYSSTTVEIYHKNILIATHPKLYRLNDTSTIKEHMPLNHQFASEKMNPTRLTNWGNSIGNETYEFVNKRLQDAKYPANVYRNIIAILRLAKLYGNNELNQALGFALSINAHTVKAIESILSKKLYMLATSSSIPANIAVVDTHENLRDPSCYR